jgi:hypothetical protein
VKCDVTCDTSDLINIFSVDAHISLSFSGTKNDDCDGDKIGFFENKKRE